MYINFDLNCRLLHFTTTVAFKKQRISEVIVYFIFRKFYFAIKRQNFSLAFVSTKRRILSFNSNKKHSGEKHCLSSLTIQLRFLSNIWGVGRERREKIAKAFGRIRKLPAALGKYIHVNPRL